MGSNPLRDAKYFNTSAGSLTAPSNNLADFSGASAA